MVESSILLTIEIGDALLFRADVLVLKHAQALYGVDAAAHAKLVEFGTNPRLPKIGAHETVSAISALGRPRALHRGRATISFWLRRDS